ncbi:MAG: tetratricopeptide repeat protein [Chloroflexota bacterium]|nr:tetratricopeptide repeat protein [Chloroflexota bacterium]
MTAEQRPDGVGKQASRVVAVLIAFATLAGAVVGYLAASAGRSGAEAESQAQTLGVQAMGSLLSSQASAQVDLETFALATQERTHAANLFQASLRGDDAADTAVEFDRALADELAARTDQLTALTPEHPDGPENDPTFPTRFLERAGRDAVRLAALQDAAIEEAEAWGANAASYAAILAVLAVSVYLLGLSLTVPARVAQRGFAAVGVVLLVAGCVWAGLTAFTTPTRWAPEAADAFADAHVTLTTASSREDYRRAEERYGRAIELRPTFARAYLERAEAAFAGGSSQRSGAISISSPDALDRATRDLQRARELGLESPLVYWNLGFDNFLYAIQTGDHSRLDESIDLTRKALELTPDEASLHFNLGVALLAAGRADEARQAYADGIGLVTDATAYGISGALTDLEITLAQRPDLAEQIAATKEFLVRDAMGGNPDTTDASVALVEDDYVKAFPGELQAGIHYENLTAADVVSVFWYYLDPQANVWFALPQVSGRIPLDGSPAFLEGSGDHYELDSFLALSFPPACLADGRYRGEVYLNGSLAGEVAAEADFGGLQASVAREMTAALCTPSDWVRSDVEAAGYLRGWVAADGSRGAYVFRVLNPALGTGDAESNALAINIQLDAFADLLLPGAVTPDEERESAGYFMGLDGQTTRWYTYDGGQILAGAGNTWDGVLTIGFVYGPDDWWDAGGEPFDVFDSFISFDAGQPPPEE